MVIGQWRSKCYDFIFHWILSLAKASELGGLLVLINDSERGSQDRLTPNETFLTESQRLNPCRRGDIVFTSCVTRCCLELSTITTEQLRLQKLSGWGLPSSLTPGAELWQARALGASPEEAMSSDPAPRGTPSSPWVFSCHHRSLFQTLAEHRLCARPREHRANRT